MKIGNKVEIKNSNYKGVVAYEVDSCKAMERRWCVYFPKGQLGDYYESDLITIE